jgi:hypothetical protein
LSFNGSLTENETASIHFTPPRGNYDKIYIDCYAEDPKCWNQDHNLTNSVDNCPDCNSISISPVLRGMKYICQALTMKESFLNVTSDEYNFNTSE